MRFAQSVTLKDDKVIMTVTDEPEMVGRIKVRRTLMFLFTELCFKKVYNKFVCEGCQEGWPSQRDHECCLRSEYDIFDSYYDDVKNDIDLDMIFEFCEQFTKLANIPMSIEWVEFIKDLPNKSAKSIYLIWKEMQDTWDYGDLIIIKFVGMLCDTMQNSEAWKSDIFEEFETYMME